MWLECWEVETGLNHGAHQSRPRNKASTKICSLRSRWGFLVGHRYCHTLTAWCIYMLGGGGRYIPEEFSGWFWLVSFLYNKAVIVSSAHWLSHVQLCHPMGCNPQGSSAHEISQERILQRVAISPSRGSSWPRDQTCISCVSCIGRWILFHCATWEVKIALLET